MSKPPSTERLQELLNTMYADIVQYVREDQLVEAEQNFYATRDYALGDTVSCTAEAAMENCEQIRSLYIGNAPRSAFENVDAVLAEIRRLEKTARPLFAGKLWIVLILAAFAFFAYFVMTHRN